MTPIEPTCPAFALELPPLGPRFAQHAAVWIVTGRELEPGRRAHGRSRDQGGLGLRLALSSDRTDRPQE